VKNILILQPYEDQAKAIAKFLKCHSKDFFIVGGFVDAIEYSPFIPYFDKLVKVSAEFATEEKEYDIIVPTGARSTHVLLSARKSIRIGNILFDQNNLQVFDKIPFLAMVEKLGVPIPETYLKTDEIKEFPVFFKQRFEKGVNLRGILYTRAELEELSQEVPIFYQEFIDSVGNYDVGFLARDGVILTYFMHNALYNWPKPGGSGVVLKTYYNERILEYTSVILKKMNYNGWGLVQFKYCHKRKDFVFMEVNAKFWASIEFAFLNNPAFLRELFGIECKQRKVDCIVFCNRLANYGLIQYVKLMIRFSSCYKLYFFASAKILCFNMVPERGKKIIRRFLALSKVKFH
jgi:hypothetical protein